MKRKGEKNAFSKADGIAGKRVDFRQNLLPPKYFLRSTEHNSDSTQGCSEQRDRARATRSEG